MELGRSWILLGGLLPVDYDDLKLAELEPGRRFLERSRTLTFSVWQHERIVEPEGEGRCRVTDRLGFELQARQSPGSPASPGSRRRRRLPVPATATGGWRGSTAELGRAGAVIFDNDGLLLDTESVWTRAEADLFARRGPRVHPRPQAGAGRDLGPGSAAGCSPATSTSRDAS